ncbi:hypothetical protein GEV43_26410 [Actinomadura sp. J1-007]|uniref:hypothetical protein n=1 Tax=Actinomadura sp. J1-007 TaxID=2661913 RepID=UPI00132CB0AE|nr:hypothetical protein [Actinomadura sp. J1-007]MWK37249.1 hypothetical protein [Actinomadura sp. J1-007]
MNPMYLLYAPVAAAFVVFVIYGGLVLPAKEIAESVRDRARGPNPRPPSRPTPPGRSTTPPNAPRPTPAPPLPAEPRSSTSPRPVPPERPPHEQPASSPRRGRDVRRR